MPAVVAVPVTVAPVAVVVAVRPGGVPVTVTAVVLPKFCSSDTLSPTATCMVEAVPPQSTNESCVYGQLSTVGVGGIAGCAVPEQFQFTLAG